ncbi:MAG TPA: outer membrane protein assembly factor BamE [Marinospirillum sp.]|uniref:outer membrane protein assembly factor BamE n=1 Tax=Marinospirillum sp. TaxID=2183934 RepID=UPI002B48F4DC|nr:outer membrane protein assembly factor BamE [Marinospirillum sp.]HKM14531.1 outer membrane protein assembly factor BamE [Marinospirillum sp.]
MHKKPTKILTFMLFAFFISVSLGGCSLFSPYQQGIPQGNILDEEAVAQLKVGMSQAQVLYILGTPLLKAPDNPNQWDYIAQLRQGQQLIERETLRLNFAINSQGELRLSNFDHQR